MSDHPSDRPAPVALEARDFDALLSALRARGYRTLAPVARDGAIAYDEIASSAELPAGWTDAQGPGRHRAEHGPSRAWFGVVHGAGSAKRWLHAPIVRLWHATRSDQGITFHEGDDPPPPLALIGLRPCDVAAVRIQDRILLGGPHPDPIYAARRQSAFLVAVQCTRAGETCFCASMGTGPRVHDGFDLALTEIAGPRRHWFLVEAGTARGREVLEAVPHRPATEDEVRRAETALASAAKGQTRRLDTAGLAERLACSYEHPHWQTLDRRCLACGNCTFVCPTCFCTTLEDQVDLAGASTERVRRWDSCFGAEFSYIHGGSVRASTHARYRHWLLHKLSAWYEQFGESGCVGCGRCITWCPVGIDITAEAGVVAGAAREEHRDDVGVAGAAAR